MRDLKYTDILNHNTELGLKLQSKKFKLRIISNLILHQIKEFFEYSLRIDGVNADATIGNFDNIIQDSMKCYDDDVVIIFWELSHLIDGLYYKSELLEQSQIEELIKKVEAEILLVLKNLKDIPLILFNRFTSLPFPFPAVKKSNLEVISDCLNQFLEENIPANVKLIDLEKIFSLVGLENSIDFRYFYRAKALYTIIFFRTYVECVHSYYKSTLGLAKKALIFDCDNTLWKGVLGEDGIDRIDMSPQTHNGSIFAEVQALALSLKQQGILIGICSKNNSQDVEEVMKSHPDMQLKHEDVAIIHCNWEDKASNLKNIGAKLNIGLDSLVFVDDSDFEIQLIREKLPEQDLSQLGYYPRISL